MGELPAFVSVDGYVDLVSGGEVIGADAREWPFMDFPCLFTALCHFHASEPAFMLPAKAVEE
jgi:hypothetical protein